MKTGRIGMEHVRMSLHEEGIVAVCCDGLRGNYGCTCCYECIV